MIFVLCDNYKQAESAFRAFMAFLESVDPWLIRQVHESSNRVDTDDDLSYIFMDYRYEQLFFAMDDADRIQVDQFFIDLSEYYDDEYFKVLLAEIF